VTNSDRFEQLADLVLDGTASPAERAELARIMDSDPTARQQYAELEAFFTDLRSMPRRAAPPDLLPTTLAALETISPPRATPRGSWIEALRSWLRPRPALRYGAVFAAGIVASTLFFVGLRSEVPHNDATMGSMMPEIAVRPVRLAIPQGTVEATVKPEGNNWIVSLESDLTQPASLVIEHNLALVALSPASGANGTFAPGTLSFELGGRTSFRITLASTGAITPVRLLLRAGSDSARGTLEIHRNSESDPQVVR
jgi:hypothetical protein